ncbi:hypothetical protein J6590_048798 [Homalodisca vitripennis]|nr:hypothetical protein J6590_048798 [Homalodisca vitripennis]
MVHNGSVDEGSVDDRGGPKYWHHGGSVDKGGMPDYGHQRGVYGLDDRNNGSVVDYRGMDEGSRVNHGSLDHGYRAVGYRSVYEGGGVNHGDYGGNNAGSSGSHNGGQDNLAYMVCLVGDSCQCPSGRRLYRRLRRPSGFKVHGSVAEPAVDHSLGPQP